MNKESDRRKFSDRIVRAGTALILLSNLAYLRGATGPTRPEFAQTVAPAEVQPRSLDRQLLREYANSLPESYYKKFINGYAGFLFNDNYPTSLSLSGLPFDLYPMTFTNKFDKKDYEVEGFATFRATRHDPVQIDRDARFFVPVPYIYPEPEIAKEIEFTIRANEPFFPGITPEIEISQPPSIANNVSTLAFMENQRKFIAVKELASLAYFFSYFELSIRKMQENNLPYLIMTSDKQSKEVITPSFTRIVQSNGRFTYVADLAGFVIAAKAFQNDHRTRFKTPRNLKSYRPNN